MSEAQVMMKFDLLPNEILLQCFEYLNAPDIFFCFNNLNFRLNQLIRHIPLYLNFEYFDKLIFNQFYEDMLTNSEIERQIVFLELSSRKIWYQIRTFLSLFLLDCFSYLRTLILDKIDDTDGKEILRIFNVSDIPHHYFTNWLEETNTILTTLPMDTIQTLSISTIPSNLLIIPQLTSVINITISHCSLKEFCRFFIHVPKLKFLKINVVFNDNDDSIILEQFMINKSIRYLQKLIINSFEGEFDDLEIVLKHTPNLKSLTISARDNIDIIDANRWQQLIPSFDVFKFKFIITYTNENDYIFEKFQEFQTEFWHTQHYWNIVWELNQHQASIYSIPYAFNKYTLPQIPQRQLNLSIQNSNLHKKVTDLTIYLEQIIENDEYQFPNVKSIKFENYSMDQNDEPSYLEVKHIVYVKKMINIENLIHLDLSSLYGIKSSLVLLQIFKETPHLISVKFHIDILVTLFDNRDLNKYFNKMIRKLSIIGIHNLRSIKHNELKCICRTFSNIEQFRCDVVDTLSLFKILKALSKLSNMELCYCTSLSPRNWTSWLEIHGDKLNRYSFSISFSSNYDYNTEIDYHGSYNDTSDDHNSNIFFNDDDS